MAITVVFGAGGPSGLECVKRLLEATENTIRAVVRSPEKYVGNLPKHDRLEVVKGDVTDKSSVQTAMAGAQSAIFAASASTYNDPVRVDNEAVGVVADAAKEARVERVVLISSQLVHPSNRWHPIRLMLNNIKSSLMDNKYAGEEKLRKSGVLSYTVIRPPRLENGEPKQATLLSEQKDTKESSGLLKRSDLAAIVVEALHAPGAHNATISVTSKPPKPASYEENLKQLFEAIKPDSAK